jgi:hypothetical protein
MLHGFGLLRRRGLLAVLACLAAVGLVIPTVAGAKVTSLTKCKLHILSPGKYRLDANIATEHTCFILEASGVTFDLNGHTITTAKRDDVGIMAFGSGAKIVGPGTISGFDVGISLVNKGHDLVRGITAIANAIGIGVNSRGNSVLDNVTTRNALVGIDVFQAGIDDNTIMGNFAYSNGLDLRDNNPNCGSNVWSGNDFGTANQSCIH